MAKILIIEDDIDIVSGITDFLEHHDHELDFAYNGRQAMDLIGIERYDLVLLDINLPYLSGLEICKALQSNKLTHIPVIIISANDQPEEVVKGFSLGAWDYLVKPFDLAELLARINVALARVELDKNIKLEKGAIRLDGGTLRIEYRSRSLQLHQTGYDIVYPLLNEAPSIIKSKDLCELVWGDEIPDSVPLRAHIYKLRQQFKAAFGAELIETVRGVGYRIHYD